MRLGAYSDASHVKGGDYPLRGSVLKRRKKDSSRPRSTLPKVTVMPSSPFDFTNPYRTVILHYAQKLLENRYGRYHDLLLRITNNIVTEKDATDFGQMFVDTWETGYMKAVEDYRKAVEAHGLKIEVKPQS